MRATVFALIASCLVFAAPALAPGGTMETIRLADFDHAGMEASYVLSKPSAWSGKKPLPLILDLHGAIHPSKKGGLVTSQGVWREFVDRVDCLVAAPNARMRGWNRVKGDKNDTAYVLAVLADVRKKHKVDAKRIYLAGFSSGSDFACKGGLQLEAKFAGTLIICPGPPNVVGIRGGELEKIKDHPFVFATGEEDYIRKAGAFEAYEHIKGLGGRALYREVPRKGHSFFGLDEYVRLFEALERLAHEPKKVAWLGLAKDAFERDDLLTAHTYAQRAMKKQRRPAQALLEKIASAGEERIEAAKEVPSEDLGQAYEAWWAVRTQLAFDTKAVETAEKHLGLLREKASNRDLLRARRDWFKRRGR